MSKRVNKGMSESQCIALSPSYPTPFFPSLPPTPSQMLFLHSVLLLSHFSLTLSPPPPLPPIPHPLIASFPLSHLPSLTFILGVKSLVSTLFPCLVSFLRPSAKPRSSFLSISLLFVFHPSFLCSPLSFLLIS